ncbi:RNA polymerase sigma factor [Bacillus sp. EB01]|uniref:RNA polymerase sigma factor n=1 Tax=Bacillus sp. EB01 TaxID=1347086 RepID=UPI0005C49370|nr:RNA polymerase sigma factor [Bacillus sp. EB01]
MADPLEELYEQYKKPVYTFLCALCHNRSVAEELTHDTFIKAFKGLKSYRGDASLKTWLFRIARNTYLNNAKKASTRYERSFAEPELEAAGRYENADAQMAVRETLLQLSEQERSLLTLRSHGFSVAEIAVVLGMTEGSIKVGLHRAKKKFRKLYYDGEVT